MCKPNKKKILIDFEELVKEEKEEDGELFLKKRQKKEMIKAKQ